jgi:hypothetical protein
MLRRIASLLVLFAALATAFAEPFNLRGYYITFMRMPVMGMPEWKQAIDSFAKDGANTLVLWMPGGFRSRKFPITWQYNEDHANVREDFARDLIDYAHTQNIRVLLGFTPFGYDGINRIPLDHPELKARKTDGSPVEEFGIHSWGWSLCPAQAESQRFMREYLREMIFDFYPNADGLLVESSDYNACLCPECRTHPYEQEFKLIRELSDELWKAKPDALVLVYPHYFTGKKVPGLEISGTKQPFDSRWGLFFTPHSAHFDSGLIRQARASVFSGPEAVLATPEAVAGSARSARAQGVTGFLPSLEAFSYVPTHSEGGENSIVGKRMRPFGFDAEHEGKMPYDELIPRIQRFAVREYSEEPEMDSARFEQKLSLHFFGRSDASQAVRDLLQLQRIWAFESDWYWASPLLNPELLRTRSVRLKWAREKLQAYDKNLGQLRQIADRYRDSEHSTEREMRRLATEVVNRWGTQLPSTTP